MAPRRMPAERLGKLLAALLLAILPIAGCDDAGSKADRKKSATNQQPLSGIKLRLTVVDDPAMATAIGRLRGESRAQTGSEFEVVNLEKDWSANSAETDAVICPSAMLGTLAAGGRIAPLPEKLLRGATAQWDDIFELLRLREAAWGGEVFAVPLGSPTLVCCYRADLLEKLGRQPPRTWEEYQELAQLLAAQKLVRDRGTWFGAIEPLEADWAAITLLARGPLRQTPRQLLHPLRHRNDGAAGGRPAVCSRLGGTRRDRPPWTEKAVGARRRRRARPSGQGSAAWP